MASSSIAPRAARRLDSVLRHQPLFEWIAAALLAMLLFWKGVLAGLRALHTDFPNYYVAARLIREHCRLDRIYDWLWFQRATDHFGIEHQLTGFLGLTPFSALPLLPFAGLPAMEAKRLWILLNIALLILTVHLLKKISNMSSRRAWLIALCAAVPLRNNFLLGQMHLVVLALLAASYACHIRGKQTASGCLIALAGALKIYPLFFCFYFIVKRRWKALAAALLCTAGCVALSYAVAGPAAMHAYLHEQLPRTLQGESLDPFLPSSTSPAALFHRLFLFEPELNPHPLLWSPLLYAMLYPLWQAVFAGLILSRLRFGFHADAREALEWSSFLALPLFLSSAPATYHYAVLIAPAIITIGALLKLEEKKSAAVFLMLYVAACNLGTFDSGHAAVSILTPLRYVKLWAGAGMLLLYFCVLAPRHSTMEPASRRFVVSPALKVAAIILCLWAGGFVNAWSHGRQRCLDCLQRIRPSDAAYLRTSPLAIDDGLLYVAMLPEGYRVLQAGKPLAALSENHSSDQLSFTASYSGKDIWVEITGATSRVVRVASSRAGRAPCEIDDAESPALSPDGSRLAFLREDHGWGSLWLFDPAKCDTDQAHADPVRVTSSALDVRGVAAGPSGSWIFGAADREIEKLYTVSPDHSPQLLVDETVSVDSPAVSPDGRRMVARKQIGGHWQLAIFGLSPDPQARSLQARSEAQLTFGDCNAYAPSWKDDGTVLYATDCARGMGMTAIAWVDAGRQQTW